MFCHHSQLHSALVVMSNNENFILKKHTRFYLSTLTAVIVGTSVFVLFSPFQSKSDLSPEVIKAIETYNNVQKEWIPELPIRLMIPAINVDAEVQYVGLAQNGTGEMDVPTNFTDVGWYQDGVRPGMQGSAVIAGHFNGKEVPQAVFYDLHTLEIGDEVVVTSAGRIEDIFQVVKIKTYAYDDVTTDIFESTDGKKRLNLITCGGEWLPEEKLYNKRTVVFTELLTDTE